MFKYLASITTKNVKIAWIAHHLIVRNTSNRKKTPIVNCQRLFQQLDWFIKSWSFQFLWALPYWRRQKMNSNIQKIDILCNVTKKKFARHFENHRCMTWHHTGSDKWTNVYPRDGPLKMINITAGKNFRAFGHTYIYIDIQVRQLSRIATLVALIRRQHI